MRTVLFVCTGNTCRSPMAEAVARSALASGGAKVEGQVFVASAGTHAFDGDAITPEAADALRRAGIAHEGKSKRLTPQMVERADAVLCMTESHARSVRRSVTGDHPRVECLDPAGDVEDPLGADQGRYDALLARFQGLIPGRLSEILRP